MNKSTRENFTAFLDRVQSALPADGKTKSVKELAEYLGKTETQVREWVITRRFKPNGAVTLNMAAWLKENWVHDPRTIIDPYSLCSTHKPARRKRNK